MPKNTVYVGRPSKYENPYKIGLLDREEVLFLYERNLRGTLATNPLFLDGLIGKDLACWCSLDQACHADVIIRILNEKNGEVKRE